MQKKVYYLLCLFFVLIFSACTDKGTVKNDASYRTQIKDEENTLQSICFGSCNKQWFDQSYWDAILTEKPDLWIWTGDIIYANTEDMEALNNQYNIQKNHPEYLRLLDACRVIGIWDDNDYGMNDGGNSYPKKKESRDLLFDFLDIPKKNIAYRREGAYQSYSFGKGREKVKIILLDGRYFRDEMVRDEKTKQRYLPNTKGTYLGETQWKWLENEFKNSDASLHILVSGVQFISDTHYFEKWANFPLERKRMLDLMNKYKLKNPVFLSGDRHIAEISAIRPYNNDQIIYDVTSSGLTHSYEKADEKNTYRIGKLIKVKNFGKIEIGWGKRNMNVKLLVMGVDGKELLREELRFNY